MDKQTIQVSVRFPREIYDALMKNSKANMRSFNAEVIWGLGWFLKADIFEQVNGTNALREKLTQVDGKKKLPPVIAVRGEVKRISESQAGEEAKQQDQKNVPRSRHSQG